MVKWEIEIMPVIIVKYLRLEPMENGQVQNEGKYVDEIMTFSVGRADKETAWSTTRRGDKFGPKLVVESSELHLRIS